MFKNKMLFLLLLIMFVMMTACSNDENASGEGNESGSGSIVTAPGEFPIVEEKVELDVLIPANSIVEDFETNEFTKWYEEKTGVHINWEIIPYESQQEQLNLILTSGEYPDVIMDMGVGRSQLRLYGESGSFLALNDLIDEYGVETKKMFEDMPLVEDVITTPEGDIFALPQVNECYHCSMPQKLWVYEPWLEELGMDIPTTTEEYKELLLAIKNTDLNGNGKADEIPLSGQYNGYYTSLATPGFLMDPFIYSDLHIVDGEVIAPWNKPEYKEGLAYLRDLYEEGLIYSGSFTQSLEQFKQLGENPNEPILGTAVSATVSFADVNGRMNDYVVIPPLEGPSGQRITHSVPNPVTRPAEFIITNKAKHPEVAFRWADAMYDEGITMRSVLGREGEEWFTPEEGVLALNGEQASYETIKLDEPVQNAHWSQTGPSLRTKEFRSSRAVPEGDLETKLWESTEQYEPYLSDSIEPIPPLFFSQEDSNEMAKIEQSLTDYYEEMAAAFITGESDLDKDWDEYINNLQQIGLDEYVNIYQRAYDEKYK
ncbi:extracellular solute-binding protein [Bacillaceae bacterium SIJ1]|uniref:extracellular solute-binding protein n=1 Tax=Litoribacterium kuwaitense TaxID=1398745 RepID=UPI0013EA42CA|nr:extracellular solute-binding protein [Litoribacterium kuwaitense]NGP43798.1 extracellular solute-binding protein [Litoribacterium kuwaitense]